MKWGRVAAGAAMTFGLAVYARRVRPWLLDWGATPEERRRPLPGDDVVNESVAAGMARHTRAVTIDAPPAAVWPWLAQVGDRRAGFYSYDWLERATGTVHYVEGAHSAAHIHPELQELKLGDRIATGSVGSWLRIDSPVTVLEPDHALVLGTWAFVLERLPGERTRLLVRQPYQGWLRQLVPSLLGPLRSLAGAIDYLVGEPLHFLMERRMMLGLKDRAERSYRQATAERSRERLPTGPAGE